MQSGTSVENDRRGGSGDACPEPVEGPSVHPTYDHLSPRSLLVESPFRWVYYPDILIHGRSITPRYLIPDTDVDQGADVAIHDRFSPFNG